MVVLKASFYRQFVSFIYCLQIIGVQPRIAQPFDQDAFLAAFWCMISLDLRTGTRQESLISHWCWMITNSSNRRCLGGPESWPPTLQANFGH